MKEFNVLNEIQKYLPGAPVDFLLVSFVKSCYDVFDYAELLNYVRKLYRLDSKRDAYEMVEGVYEIILGIDEIGKRKRRFTSYESFESTYNTKSRRERKKNREKKTRKTTMLCDD